MEFLVTLLVLQEHLQFVKTRARNIREAEKTLNPTMSLHKKIVLNKIWLMMTFLRKNNNQTSDVPPVGVMFRARRGCMLRTSLLKLEDQRELIPGLMQVFHQVATMSHLHHTQM